MFFLVERKDILSLRPQYFGKKVKEEVLKQLRHKVEGKCDKRYGYTIHVIDLTNVGKGCLDLDTGNAEFPVVYTTLVFKPFLNEILPAKVKKNCEQGFFAYAGPIEIYVSHRNMPSDLKFDPRQDGLPVFYSEEEEDIRIEVGSLVRVKVINYRLDQDKIAAIGTINADYLG
jgi:DNA-directed RNA polymerase II subunit RPB7